MAYLAIEKMRKKNELKFGRGAGPMQPKLSPGAKTGFDLKASVLRFLHESCENLCFDSGIEEEEERTGLYQGTSMAPKQIPYNMQMDINRLCLERELEKFMDSGATQDAYTVYYCFLEIFFGDRGRLRKMEEWLSEYETNGSSLLTKHRDHYTHSVYAFALGIRSRRNRSDALRQWSTQDGFVSISRWDGPSAIFMSKQPCRTDSMKRPAAQHCASSCAVTPWRWTAS